jgi:hypothetical protein
VRLNLWIDACLMGARQYWLKKGGVCADVVATRDGSPRFSPQS